LSFSVLTNVHKREQKISVVENRNDSVPMYSPLPHICSPWIHTT